MSHSDRLHSLDAVRAFALLLGVVFHAGFSFLPGLIPGIWAMTDNSPSSAVAVLLFTSHIFRMSLFFLVAGFFARMMVERQGWRGFWTNRLKRIFVPLVAGWVVLFPAIAVVWIWGITKTFNGVIPPPPAEMPPSPPGAFPLTHLWFLYYLLVLYAVLYAVRAVAVACDRDGRIRRVVDVMVRRSVSVGAAAVLLPLPLIASLYFRDSWVVWFGIPTPDHSLIPEASSLVGYGTAMAFGWLVHRQAGILATWGRQWPAHLAGAVAATGLCLWLVGVAPVFVPHPRDLSKLAFALSYGVAIWCWSFAVIGVGVRYLSHPRAGIRYMADASYWIYLVHLPIVAAFQVVVGRLPWHWSIKFPLILVASLTLLLASYRYLVRSTFVGQLLNGRRYPRAVGGAAPVPSPSASRLAGTSLSEGLCPSDSPTGSLAGTPAPRSARQAHSLPLVRAVSEIASSDLGAQSTAEGPSGDSAPLALLEGVHKRYGTTVALAGLDLDVRRGELLAVLGPNGAGKSTAISLWLGLLEPDAGNVRLFGESPLDVDARRRVGVMMQEVGLTPELRVRELVELTASYYPAPLETREVLSITGIEALADRPYAKLSAGQKRQVQFALAICGRPPLLFLDEPTVGLDVEARETMWRTIRALLAQGCSIVLTTHYLEEAEALADRVAVLANGRLITSGSVDEIRALVSRKQITCSTTISVDEVSQWPGVLSAVRSIHRLQVTASDAESVVRRLLSVDAGVRDLEVRQAGLAEAFSELTKEAA